MGSFLLVNYSLVHHKPTIAFHERVNRGFFFLHQLVKTTKYLGFLQQIYASSSTHHNVARFDVSAGLTEEELSPCCACFYHLKRSLDRAIGYFSFF